MQSFYVESQIKNQVPKFENKPIFGFIKIATRFENRSLFTFAENGSMILEPKMAAKVNGLAIPDEFEELSCHSWEYSDKYYKDTGLTEFSWVCDQANYQQLMQVKFKKKIK